MIEIREDDLSGARTRALLAIHLAGMHASSPPESVFALDVSGLQAPGITVWSAWDGDSIAGIGALKRLGDRQAEIKSMRTHPDHLRKGVARTLLARIIDQARGEGIVTLNLETGRGPAFEPALALYRAHGFVNGSPFGDYAANPFSQFLYLAL
ncbi:GNAT family N-acetyltransferase [Sphingomonas sp. MMS24-J13]|uniref:GNAT family N-acetyltransferase n=1 Tax=Sphingomonas sp. MMS24-J13 TaxID=3238686 RepID=UPI00384DCC86